MMGRTTTVLRVLLFGWLAVFCVGGVLAEDAVPADTGVQSMPETQVFLSRFRLSALVGSGPDILVGLADRQAEDRAYLLRCGDVLDGYRLVSGDYDGEFAIFERAGTKFPVGMEGDPEAAARAAAQLEEDRPRAGDAAFRKFVTEHPDLRMADGTPLELPADAGAADEGSFEAFVRRHTGAAPQPAPTVFGQPPPSMLPPPPPVTNAAPAATPEEVQAALEKMAESVGMIVPADATKPVTFEDFIRMHEEEQPPGGLAPGPEGER